MYKININLLLLYREQHYYKKRQVNDLSVHVNHNLYTYFTKCIYRRRNTTKYQAVKLLTAANFVLNSTVIPITCNLLSTSSIC